MNSISRTAKALGATGFSLVCLLLTPVFASPAVAETPGCCQTPMGGDGCEDTFVGKCRSEGECHSQFKKSCNITIWECAWEDDSNCPGKIE